MKKKEIITTIYEYEAADKLKDADLLLINKAKEACNNSYSPYSHFSVGAAVLLENGEIISASNQENAAYPSGLCAERVAIFYANSKYPDVAVKSIAIASANKDGFIEKPVPPCGACRQVLMETEQRFKKNIKVILAGNNKVFEISSVEQLLPLSFDSRFLK